MLAARGALLSLLLLATASLCQAMERNVILDDLLEHGISIGNRRVRLPAATLADRLTAQQQQQALSSITDGNHSLDVLLRKSVVAPFVLRITNEPNAGQGRPRRVDFWFVAHGDFDVLKDEDFFNQQVDAEAQSKRGGSLSQGVILSEDQLHGAWRH